MSICHITDAHTLYDLVRAQKVGERCAAESISTSRPDAQSLDEPSKQKFLQPLRDDGAAVWKVEEGEGISENTFDVES